MSTTTRTRTCVTAPSAVTLRVTAPACSNQCSAAYATSFASVASAIPAAATNVKWHRKDMAGMHATARRGDRLH
ncbi:MAG: hypothetical protein ACKO04_10290 [Actinomycetes bacterium]